MLASEGAKARSGDTVFTVALACANKCGISATFTRIRAKSLLIIVMPAPANATHGSTSLAQHQDTVTRLGWRDEGIVFAGCNKR